MFLAGGTLEFNSALAPHKTDREQCSTKVETYAQGRSGRCWTRSRGGQVQVVFDSQKIALLDLAKVHTFNCSLYIDIRGLNVEDAVSGGSGPEHDVLSNCTARKSRNYERDNRSPCKQR